MKTFWIKHNMNCNSKDLIYVLQCRGCHALYVGQTGDTLRSRTRVHRQQVKDRDYRVLFVSKHISSCSQSDPPFSIIPILKLPPNCDRAYRENKEKWCISVIRPSLNRDQWFSPTLDDVCGIFNFIFIHDIYVLHLLCMCSLCYDYLNSL